MNYIAVFHAHHSCPLPLEFIPSFEDRIREIDTVKAREETPGKIARRKSLFRVVVGELPQGLAEAWAAYDQAWAALDQARAALDQAWAAFDQARAAYEPEIMALHATECGCGWTPAQPNIFEYQEET